jgi:capsular polysaccharide biosynthesis protein
MKVLFSPPSFDDLIRLLKAWKFWLLGGIIGALLGAGFYYVAPPPYRAQATVLVDFNMEEAWPQETDREQFYYLERETRKLEEIAFSDAVMQAVVETDGDISIAELKTEFLSLSQPAEGGWHFYADDMNPRRAAIVTNAWAEAFVEQVNEQVKSANGLNAFIDASLAQSAQAPTGRSVSVSVYMFAGAAMLLVLASFHVLFVSMPK